MSDSSSKQATNFLQADSQELHQIFAKVRLLNQLSEQILPILDDNIRAYCQVANVVGQKLVLLAANGSIATQVRFQLLDLLRKFKQIPMLASIQEIQCKVHPGMRVGPVRGARKNSKMQPLSQATAGIIAETAKSLEDPKLREIMERIAGRKKL